MTQYNMVKVKLSASQLNKLNSETKIATDITLGLSSNMVCDNESNFSHRQLLTDRQGASLRKAVEIKSSGNIKLVIKTQLFKIIQSGGSFGRLLGPLMKDGLSLMKNVLQSLA